MNSTPTDEQARRYWSTSLEKAYDLVQALYRVPLEECGEEMVSLEDAARALGVEVTFSSRPHAEGSPRIYYVRRGIVDAVLEVAEEMNGRGWVLHVEDAFRTYSMQRGLWRLGSFFQAILGKVRWELGGAAPTEQLMFRRVSALLAPCPRIGGHLCGAAIDVSVFRRDGRAELDRGGPYLEAYQRTPMDSPFVSDEARRNRKAITEIFEAHGFAPYPFEFWHYNRGDVQEAAVRGTGGPARYGPVNLDPATGRVRPLANQTEPFVSFSEVRQRITEALASGERI